jgi:uncharacterized protein (DUF58 family)
MLPIPAQTAVLAFGGCVAMLLSALWWSSPAAAALAGSGLLGLALAFALTVPLGARLRRQRLEFAWWLAAPQHGSSGAVAGAPFEVYCQLKNRSRDAVRFAALLPVVPAGVHVHEGSGRALGLGPRTRSEFSFRLTPSAAGRVVLQGLAVTVPGPFGLFFAPLYFPSPLGVKVLPRSAALFAGSARPASGQAVERTGLAPVRRRGSGMELHEIREHQPGDAFKSIAWKASARAGTLLVREVEREVQDTLYIVLDVSGSMRGGAPGERKLDHCIDVAALLARQALERGDRVGLLTVDGRTVAHVPDAEGLRHMLRIYEALLAASEVVDADLTDIEDRAVAALVARYVRQQEGVDPTLGSALDLAALAAHAARSLQSEPMADAVVASTPEHAMLRRFCRVRGIGLPYRAETPSEAKVAGLAQALRTAAGATRTPRTLRVLTDFDGMRGLAPLAQTLRMLKARAHAVAFMVPRADSLGPEPSRALERDLRRVYGLEEERRLREVKAELGKLGVPLLSYDAREGLSAIARKADALRRVA